MRQDLVLAWRMLRRSPGFTVVAVFTLALGVGANTAVFSVVKAVLLRPLPYPEPDRLTLLWQTEPQIPVMSIAYPDYIDWRGRAGSFDELAVYRRTNVNLALGDDPERVHGAQVSANLFAALGVLPQHGRVFLEEEDRPGGAEVVVLSNNLWQRRFGGDPALVGSTVRLDGKAYEVIGIMPRGFAFPSRAELWFALGPQSTNPDWRERGNHPGIFGIARLKEGVHLTQARTEMAMIAEQLGKAYPATNRLTGAVVTSLEEWRTQGIRPALLMLFGAVGFVLLIACTNVANLLLERASTRQREIALRRALGATWKRIMRQMVVETVVLATAGGLLGFLLAGWGTDVLLSISADALPSDTVVRMDGGVLFFALALSLLTGLVFGMVPALEATRSDSKVALGASRRSGNPTGGRMRSVLVGAEIAMAAVLLAGAGLLGRSFLNLMAVDPGLRPEGLLSARMSLSETRYGEKTLMAELVSSLLEQIDALPAVESGAVTSNLPLVDGSQTSVSASGRPSPEGQNTPLADYGNVSPDYFKTMGIPLLKGRTFTKFDTADGDQVALVDEKLAEQLWPGENPVGKMLVLGPEDTPEYRKAVVGVVGSVRLFGLDEPPQRGQVYFPYAQRPERQLSVVVRTKIDPNALAGPLRAALRRIDAEQPLYDVRGMEGIVSESVAHWRMNMVLMAAFAGVALTLAVVGIYGVMSYAVVQQTPDIGIRKALGASSGTIMRMVLTQGMRLSIIGMTMGLVGVWLLTRLMESQLFGVTANDPATLLSTVLVLLGVAIIACWVPARKAMKLEPMQALRYE